MAQKVSENTTNSFWANSEYKFGEQIDKKALMVFGGKSQTDKSDDKQNYESQEL